MHCSLFILIKPKAKYIFDMAGMLFNILQKVVSQARLSIHGSPGALSFASALSPSLISPSFLLHVAG
jgi:hypothetical protein